MTLTRERRFTYEDYRKLPDELRVELINGEFFVSPSPSFGHQDVIGTIFSYLWQWVENCNLGKVLVAPFDVKFSKDEIVQPDILFISKKRFGIIHPPNIQGAPDLVIEVLSPGNESHDLLTKRKLYEKYKVLEYWFVDPRKKSITVMNRKGKKFKVTGVYNKPKDTVESAVVTGFRISISEIFRGLRKH